MNKTNGQNTAASRKMKDEGPGYKHQLQQQQQQASQ